MDMKAKIKCYRCGWCGQPCDRNDHPLTEEQIKFLDPFVNWGNAEPVNGWCCPNGDESMVQVTHDMAIDAGYPEMEGQWIKW
jgi:hypothetical protein